MSTIYVLEPPTKGKVIINTTYGPLDVELWPKEAPKAVRNFVQLCLEGYYHNNIIHRIIKGFLVQTGDPTGTGTGGESIYGKVFSDEFHSRLRFKHRGLVACANAGPPHSNGSQFFFTLDRCDWLDKKNTIFGKVTGDSIFNLLRLGEVETDKDDRPLDPVPKILSVEVLWNPFDDIIPRVVLGELLSHSTADTEEKGQKKKAVKKLSLLSFGEEAEKEEIELAGVKAKIKSSHDVLNDPRLLKEHMPKEADPVEVKRTRDLQLTVREALNSKKEGPEKGSERSISGSHNHSDDDDEAQFDQRMRLQILKKRQELGDAPATRKSHKEECTISQPRLDKEHATPPTRSDNEDSDDQPKPEKLSFRRKGIGSEARAERLAEADVDMQLLNRAEKLRQMQKQKKRRREGREKEALEKLQKFKSSFFSKPTPSSEEAVDGTDDNVSGWITNKLKFNPETSGKDKMARTEKADDYTVVDPLWENGKEKFNKMQAKLKRRDREWAGKSLT